MTRGRAGKRDIHTATVRHDAFPPHLRDALPVYEPPYCMECPAHLEGADALKVLALEEEPEFWFCRLVAFPWGANERVSGLGCGCEGGKCRVGLHGCEVYVRFDELVSGEDGGPG